MLDQELFFIRLRTIGE